VQSPPVLRLVAQNDPAVHAHVTYPGKEMWRRNLSLWALVGRWWPVPVVLCGSLVIQKVFFESRYDVAGHAAGHLSSASTFFFACAVVIILLWATPSALREPDVLVACAAWLAATALVLVGNVRVVDALVDAGLGQTPTGSIPASADIEAAHDLANLAPWCAVITALGVTAALWWRGHVSTRVAVGAAVGTVLIPPWIVPGAGVIVLVVARCIARGRSLGEDVTLRS
jgi:hypothetical protein